MTVIYSTYYRGIHIWSRALKVANVLKQFILYTAIYLLLLLIPLACKGIGVHRIVDDNDDDDDNGSWMDGRMDD